MENSATFIYLFIQNQHLLNINNYYVSGRQIMCTDKFKF